MLYGIKCKGYITVVYVLKRLDPHTVDMYIVKLKIYVCLYG